MAIYNPLNWQNENALTNYPFEVDFEFQNFIVDAKFVQFDNFIPTLTSVFVDTDKIEITIKADCGTVNGIYLTQAKYALGEPYRSARIYQISNSRYLGVIVFGEGAQTLWDDCKGQTLKFNTPFSTETVRSIPSKDAVYLFDSSYGDITLGRTEGDSTLFYNASEVLNSITFNAVTGHSVQGSNDIQALKQINLVRPLNNNINLASNDIIKILPVNSSSLQISLVAGSKSSAFTIPTLIA